jgi:hypothetical protein
MNARSPLALTRSELMPSMQDRTSSSMWIGLRILGERLAGDRSRFLLIDDY